MRFWVKENQSGNRQGQKTFIDEKYCSPKRGLRADLEYR